MFYLAFSAPTHTLSGVIIGTAGYMAPEQVTSEPVDARADLFAVRVMLYEMLAGRHPFRCASTFETLHAVLTIDPTDVASVNPRVPDPLARVVMRLLARTPGARFQSALDLIWALEQTTTTNTGRVSAAGRYACSRGGVRARPRGLPLRDWPRPCWLRAGN